MSGGSFNYLYTKEISEDIAGYLEESQRMLKALKEDYDSPKRHIVAGQMSRCIEIVKLSKSLLDEAQNIHEDLSNIIHAIEWHRSADYCKDDVEELLNEVR